MSTTLPYFTDSATVPAKLPTVAALPYFADSATVPAKLPTVAEIISSQEFLRNSTGHKVVGIGYHFVVKYGPRVDLLEGETMRFLEHSTSIPVPRVYAIFQDHDTQHNYIIMERIWGETLASVWPRMDNNEKEATVSALRSSLEQMRKLKSPGGYCRLGHHGLPDEIFCTADPLHTGRFDTESDLNDALIARYIESGLSKFKADFYSRVFKRVFRDHEPVFTHADFQRKNIMVRNHGEMQSKIVIIDWETAGWYPSYWEYVIAIFTCGRFSDDWDYWVDRMLEPALNEYPWMHMFLLEMWS